MSHQPKAQETETLLDTSDRFIYNQTSGALFYDADGTGVIAQVQFASLTGTPTLTAADIFMV